MSMNEEGEWERCPLRDYNPNFLNVHRRRHGVLMLRRRPLLTKLGGNRCVLSNRLESTERNMIEHNQCDDDGVCSDELFDEEWDGALECTADNVREDTVKLTAEIFRDDSLSEGGRVKNAGEVLATRESNCNRSPNVNCRVESLGRFVETCVVGSLKRKWVMEIGFGGLLNLAYKELPRTLCY